jgi:hypothetical protein
LRISIGSSSSSYTKHAACQRRTARCGAFARLAWRRFAAWDALPQRWAPLASQRRPALAPDLQFVPAMKPSEIRQRILRDHRGLRNDLERLEALAADVRAGRPCGALRVDAEALLAWLKGHMRWEESYLLPALREADAWGAERAERLLRDHREQRELLEFLNGRLQDEGQPAVLVVRDVTQLIELLRDDMRAEEAELLDERVLRDDVVAIDAVSS